jgi:hypothetical protein
MFLHARAELTKKNGAPVWEGFGMHYSILSSPVADQAPAADFLTDYDRDHLRIHLRLLDAETDGADWMEVALAVLEIDPIREPGRARGAWASHLARAKWMTVRGYRHLLYAVH